MEWSFEDWKTRETFDIKERGFIWFHIGIYLFNPKSQFQVHHIDSKRLGKLWSMPMYLGYISKLVDQSGYV